MTPLAHRVARELTLPLKRRTFDDQGGVLKKLSGIHCFEVSEAADLLRWLARDVQKIKDGPEASFLPAPKTWIEAKAYDGRIGFFLLEKGNGDIVDCHYIISNGEFFASTPLIKFSLTRGELTSKDGYPATQYQPSNFHAVNLVPAMLLLINSPRVIGRRQHMPHRGLEKKLVAALPLMGKFPLQAWTEIKLEVNPRPRDLSAAPSIEAHLTGLRALHFCRSHLRVRLGRLEVVRSHWRGDASLGIKQSRYKLAM